MHTNITWTDTAWEHWGAVRDRIRMIRSWFGDPIADAHEANLLDTFANVTFAAGPVNIQKDGDGFYITTPTIVIGLIWTPDNDQTMLDRLGARCAEFAAGNDGWIPGDWPRTGRWSAHS